MKLIIQIPCLNEEKSLPLTLSQLPRSVPGFAEVEWLVIDDGSSDKTVEIAKSCGVDHIVRHRRNQGLAKSFMSGLSASLKVNADVIVNTDADNQYPAGEIGRLTKPILDGKADLVIGARDIENTKHFSFIKKQLQKMGSWVVRKASGTNIPDAPSGFRAMSRAAASHFIVFNDYTYTLETIIQAGQMNMAIDWILVKTNPDLRPSRLVKSMFSYVERSAITIFRIFLIYRPFKFLSFIASLFFFLGLSVGFRFLFFYFTNEGRSTGHIQSLILAAIFLIFGFGTFLLALIAELLAANRKIAEDIRIRLSSQGF